MKIKLPERLAGTRDALFVLEVEFPVATEERTLEVVTSGSIEALDLRGTGPGGVYKVPVGFEQLHVPMRVKEDAHGEAKVVVNLTSGPDSPQSEERTLLLEKGPEGPAASGAGGKLAVGGVILAALAAAAIWLGPKLFGGDTVPEVAGLTETAASDALRKADYVVEVVMEDVPSREQDGLVLRTIPAAGATHTKGEKVQVVVGNAQDRLVKVDSVVGQGEDSAVTALKAADFQVRVEYVDAKPGEEPGRVLRQSPDRGAFVERGTEIELWVARAPLPTQPDQPPTQPDQPPTQPDQPPTQPDQPPTQPDQPPTQPDQPPTQPDQPPTQPDQPPTQPDQPPTQPDQPPTQPADGMVGVPDFQGMGFADAERKLEQLGLFAIPEYETVADAAQGDRVLRQLPAANERISPGTQVFLTIGRYQAPTQPDQPPTQPDQPPTQPDQPPTQPDQPPTQPDQPPTQPDQPPTQPDQPPTQPDRPPTQPDRPPTQPGVVPDLIGLSRELATGLVRQAGFHPRVHLEETADVPDGQVLSQKPGPGAPLGLQGTIDVIVARAPARRGVPIPDVLGKSRDEAERILRAEGFLVSTVYTGGGADEVGRVADQDPPGGSFGERRTWVGIAVVRGPGPRVPARAGSPAPLPLDDRAPSVPGGSSDLTGPPAVGPGGSRLPPPTPSGARPVPPVRLPPRDAPATLAVPDVKGRPVHQAIEGILAAGLVPIIEMDRTAGAPAGRVSRQAPQAAASARPGDIVRLGVPVDEQGERYVNLPTALGGLLQSERAALAAKGLLVEVVEVSSPGHPYAGTGRVAAQFPVSAVPRRVAQKVTLWVVR